MTFWPGLRWRLFVHRRTEPLRKGYTDRSYTLRSDVFEGEWELDELVIDHWFHIEQMNTRDWWIGLGAYEDGSDYWRINVHIDGKKRVRVSMEQEKAA